MAAIPVTKAALAETADMVGAIREKLDLAIQKMEDEPGAFQIPKIEPPANALRVLNIFAGRVLAELDSRKAENLFGEATPTKRRRRDKVTR